MCSLRTKSENTLLGIFQFYWCIYLSFMFFNSLYYFSICNCWIRLLATQIVYSLMKSHWYYRTRWNYINYLPRQQLFISKSKSHTVLESVLASVNIPRASQDLLGRAFHIVVPVSVLQRYMLCICTHRIPRACRCPCCVLAESVNCSIQSIICRHTRSQDYVRTTVFTPKHVTAM